MDFVLVINVFCILNLLLLSGLLFFGKKASVNSRLLSLSLLSPSLFFLRNLLVLRGMWDNSFFVLFFPFLDGIVYAPLFYAFCRGVLGKDRWWHKTLIWVSVLFLLAYLGLMFRYYFFLGAEDRIAELDSLRRSVFPPLYSWSLMLGLGLQFAYFLSGFILANKERKSPYSDDMQRYSRLFVFQLASLKLFLMTLWIVIYLFMPIDEARLIAIPVYGFLIFVFLYYKLFQYSDLGILSAFTLDKETAKIAALNETFSESESAIREKNTIEKEIIPETDEAIGAVYGKLVELMTEEKLYRNQGLTLQQLAEKVETDIHTLSMSINRKAEMNFFNFVNRYRIEESLELLRSVNEDYVSIEDIAFQVGFNSRTAFYTSFKRQTGKTPTQFMEEYPSEN